MTFSLKKSTGVSLLEVLIVVAVIGLIGTFSAIAVRSARSEQRDAVRLSHIRQMQSALENYFVQTNTYPQGDNIVFGSGESGCLSQEGFVSSCSGTEQIFMKRIPANISTGIEGLVRCADVPRAYCYHQVKEGEEYFIEFELENPWPLSGLQKGVNCAYSEGMRAGTCFGE